MPRPTDMRVVDVAFDIQRLRYRTPIKFGGRVVTDAVMVHVALTAETMGGQRAVGHGSMPMGNTWAWPTDQVTSETTLAAMIRMAERLAERTGALSQSGHPLALTRELGREQGEWARQIERDLDLAEPIPPLAQLVAASPIEAAIHDAYGKALERSAYDVLSEPFVGQDLSAWLNDDFRGEYLDQYTLRAPKPSMPLYHLVGALDPLTDQEVTNPIGDGLPETLSEWIVADGLTHLKVKLNGDDLQWDVDRLIAVERVAADAQQVRGCEQWFYSLDFNERCANLQYVLEFLQRVTERFPSAMQRVQYIEQPTHRDLGAHRENRMHEAARIKPVVIDESLVDLDSLLLAREQGYSGVALKACKGHSEALLMAAAAQKYGMFLCVQDLTCPGASFLHSASLAARVPGVAGIESNGRQYCPAGNVGWDQRFPEMFHITDGTVGTGILSGPGLGF